ncbi:PD-(D/E)XK nuclease family protein [Natrialbaceae archaeon AArc-T1-2]|uniref:PD-(D/E)XK nuclease family protein n=1 Tax=Natrialbaceae archaeon AArc-T1-2 TaxID=3053904 RepID=UPI00255A8161|nr:PD-(D/E)XK nuclease family protein [Natrialbaceae archaeon AArc-T1-2]WIV67357.1 hypothetical protein QQ977_01115 [Natrialbaceae archaeon AArc-T1-2]
MSLENRSYTTSIQERDIDLLFIQLVETSSEFCRWFCQQLFEDSDIEELLSVSKSVDTGNGESDIEIGIETVAGDRVLLLVENKIDASLQDRQAERYQERGVRYVEKDICDTFSVGLIAPADYVNENDREAFGNIITYESIITCLDGLSHDATPFVSTLLEQAIEKHAGSHDGHSPVTKKIRQQVQERSDEFPDLVAYETSNNLVRFRSTHPEHPKSVRYVVWVIGSSGGREAMVRLSIANNNPDLEIKAIQEYVTEEFGSLDGFEIRDHVTMDTVRTYVTTGRDASPTNDDYIEDIVSTLQRLVSFSHPRFVESGQFR